MENTCFYQTDCVSVYSQINYEEKQIRLKTRWLMGLPTSKSKPKQVGGPNVLKNRSLPESLLRQDDIFYENVKTCVEEAFGARKVEVHNATQADLKMFDTHKITRIISSCLDELTTKGLYLLTLILTGGSVKFEKTRWKMKKVIRDHIPIVLRSQNHNHHQMEIYRQLSQLLNDPQNFRNKGSLKVPKQAILNCCLADMDGVEII